MENAKTKEEKAMEDKATSDSFMKLQKLTRIGGLEKSEAGQQKAWNPTSSTINIENFKKSAKGKQVDLGGLGLNSKEETEKYIDTFLLNELDLLYDDLDINGNDFLQAEEILWTFKQFGVHDVTLEECVAVCEEFSGQKELDIITLHDFKGGMYDYMKHGTTDQQLRMVFDLMDYKKTGLVGPPGLARLFAMFGLQLHPTELLGYIDEIDMKKTGVFYFAQFKIYCAEFDLFGKLKNRFDTLVTKECEATDDEESLPSNPLF